jgi:hypothetical protein
MHQDAWMLPSFTHLTYLSKFVNIHNWLVGQERYIITYIQYMSDQCNRGSYCDKEYGNGCGMKNNAL